MIVAKMMRNQRNQFGSGVMVILFEVFLWLRCFVLPCRLAFRVGAIAAPAW